MKIIILVVSLFLFASCEKQLTEVNSLRLSTIVADGPFANTFDADMFWCFDNIACWGDSFTFGDGPSSYSYPKILGQAPGKEVFNGGYSGQTSPQIRDRFMADQSHRKWAAIIWVGRNNLYRDGISDTAQIAADIRTMIAALGHDKYLILEVLNGDWGHEYKGREQYDHIQQFNKQLAAEFRGHFVYLKPLLLSKATTGQDALCVEHDVVPASLRTDELHLNAKGYGYVVDAIRAKLSVCSTKSYIK